jgi:kynureninase
MSKPDVSLERARALDAKDPLAKHRERFCFPRTKSGDKAIYLTGNSLGLMPKDTEQAVVDELRAWAERGVDGHFEGERPWFSYHELFRDSGAAVVGAVPGEVVAMNSLTVNLHLLMVSFYRPTKERFCIATEANAFPSDRYAVASQARFHGFDPSEAVVEIAPRAGESTLATEDIERFLEEQGQGIALLLLGGVNYYTGQAYDLERIARAARKQGIVVGLDLAHAAGNLALRLHDWDVDFAAWCTYKYLNAGPGGVGMCFVHERHARDASLPRFAGWWGNDPKTRFAMGTAFSPQEGAAGWQLSNAPILAMAALRASLALFAEVGMPALRAKSEQLTAYLFELIDDLGTAHVEPITPRDPAARGSQVSLRVHGDPERLLALLQERGVVCDFRRPDVIRAAPVPLYSSFEDVWRFVDTLRAALGGTP